MAYNTPAFAPTHNRLIQFGLTTLYLLLDLLVSLTLGGLGALIILVLIARALFCGSIWRELCVLRKKAGQEVFRS